MALNQKNVGSQYIGRLKLNKIYHKVVFHPFSPKKQPHLYAQCIFQSHDAYQHNTRKRDVNGVTPESDLVMFQDGTSYSINDLFLNPVIYAEYCSKALVDASTFLPCVQ